VKTGWSNSRQIWQSSTEVYAPKKGCLASDDDDVMGCPNFPRNTRVHVTLVARLPLSPVAQKLCSVYLRAEHVFILEHLLRIEIFCCCS
jgi:hypothetical protein